MVGRVGWPKGKEVKVLLRTGWPYEPASEESPGVNTTPYSKVGFVKAEEGWDRRTQPAFFLLHCQLTSLSTRIHTTARNQATSQNAPTGSWV